MSMTLASRRELSKLRELVHFLLAGAGASHRSLQGDYVCCFCLEPMHDADFVRHGNAVGPKFTEKLSIHHVNEDHDDNRMSNKALAHTSCHKGHHRSLANKMRKINVPHVQGE